jgi:hypothetical protein
VWSRCFLVESKITKNRLHLDVTSGNRLSDVERRARIEEVGDQLVTAGALIFRRVDSPSSPPTLPASAMVEG